MKISENPEDAIILQRKVLNSLGVHTSKLPKEQSSAVGDIVLGVCSNMRNVINKHKGEEIDEAGLLKYLKDEEHIDFPTLINSVLNS
ncbi:hypothetical protein K9L27_03625 [Candidatus Gracilibacteria bacterium]|nr:hypothetical protein [Candidatus Gracilibacteria bacterium]